MNNVRFGSVEQRRAGEPAAPSRCRVPKLPSNVRLHRLAEVRKREGVSVRAMARRLGITSSEVRRYEQSYYDIPLRVVVEWAAALRMPIAELVVDADNGLPPHLLRAQLVRAMKDVRAIALRANEKSIRLFAADIIERLIAVMPELADVAAEQDPGVNRRAKLGRIATEEIPIAWLTGRNDE